MIFDAAEHGLVWEDSAAWPDFPLGNPYFMYHPHSNGSAGLVAHGDVSQLSTDGANSDAGVSWEFLQGRSWYIKEGTNDPYSTNHALHSAVMTNWRCVYQPKRTAIRFTVGALDFEQNDICHREKPIVVSRLAITNNDTVQREINLYPILELFGTSATKSTDFLTSLRTIVNEIIIEDEPFDVPMDHRQTCYIPGMTEWETNAATFFGAGGDANPSALAGALSNTSSYTGAAPCFAGKVSLTIPAGQTATAYMLFGVVYANVTNSATLLTTGMQELETYGLDQWYAEEIATIDGWFDNLALQTPNQKINDYMRYAIANIYGALTHQWFDPTKKAFWHGGPQIHNHPVSGARFWEYIHNRIHQSYPMQNVLLMLGDYAPVKSEIAALSEIQSASGQMAVEVSYSIPSGYHDYSSAYNEMMFVMCLYNYLCYSQDFDFLAETTGTRTILNHALAALDFLHANRNGGLIRTHDWDDVYGGEWLTGATPPNSKAFQGSCCYIMACRRMAEILTHEGNPTLAATYTSRADAVKAILQSSEWFDATNNLYRRFWVNGAFVNSTIDDLQPDGLAWAIQSGVSSDISILDHTYGYRTGPYNAIQALPDAFGNGYYEQGWPELFFIWAKTEARLRSPARSYASWVCPFDVPETGRISFYPETTTYGSYTWSADAEFIRWVLEGLMGVTVRLDGMITANPLSLPAGWGEEDVAATISIAGASYNIVDYFIATNTLDRLGNPITHNDRNGNIIIRAPRGQ